MAFLLMISLLLCLEGVVASNKRSKSVPSRRKSSVFNRLLNRVSISTKNNPKPEPPRADTRDSNPSLQAKRRREAAKAAEVHAKQLLQQTLKDKWGDLAPAIFSQGAEEGAGLISYPPPPRPLYQSVQSETRRPSSSGFTSWLRKKGLSLSMSSASVSTNSDSFVPGTPTDTSHISGTPSSINQQGGFLDKSPTMDASFINNINEAPLLIQDEPSPAKPYTPPQSTPKLEEEKEQNRHQLETSDCFSLTPKEELDPLTIASMEKKADPHLESKFWIETEMKQRRRADAEQKELQKKAEEEREKIRRKLHFYAREQNLDEDQKNEAKTIMEWGRRDQKRRVEQYKKEKAARLFYGKRFSFDDGKPIKPTEFMMDMEVISNLDWSCEFDGNEDVLRELEREFVSEKEKQKAEERTREVVERLYESLLEENNDPYHEDGKHNNNSKLWLDDYDSFLPDEFPQDLHDLISENQRIKQERKVFGKVPEKASKNEDPFSSSGRKALGVPSNLLDDLQDPLEEFLLKKKFILVDDDSLLFGTKTSARKQPRKTVHTFKSTENPLLELTTVHEADEYLGLKIMQ